MIPRRGRKLHVYKEDCGITFYKLVPAGLSLYKTVAWNTHNMVG